VLAVLALPCWDSLWVAGVVVGMETKVQMVAAPEVLAAPVVVATEMV
jgi:hypothetical protein